MGTQAKILPDAKGYGMVTAMVRVGNMAEAAAAIDSLNGQAVEVTVIPDTSPMANNMGGGGGGGFGGKGDGGKGGKGGKKGGKRQQVLDLKYVGRTQEPGDTVYVSGLPAKMNKEMVKNMFNGQGLNVVEVWHTPDKFGSGYCVATVQVATKEQAAMAISLFAGQVVEINEDPNNPLPLPEPEAPAAPPAQKALSLKYAGYSGQPYEWIFMSGVPVFMVETMIRQMFAGAGLNVKSLQLHPDKLNTGYTSCTVEFATLTEATTAIASFDGKYITADS